MWWDVQHDSSAVDLTGDETVVADAALLTALAAMNWDDLRILDNELRQLETYFTVLPDLEYRDVKAETEIDFVDRPIDGEVVLSAPREGNILLFATALNRQILAAPVRWQLDLHENLCTIIETRLQRQPRSDRVRRGLIRLIHRLTRR